MYTERSQIPHLYRKSDPTSIQGAPTTVNRKKNASSIQKETMADVYRKNVTRDVYRENDPTLIQRDITPPLYTEKVDSSCIQKEPSWALNEVTID